MFKNLIKKVNPLHALLAVLAFVIAVTIVVLIARTINFSDFILKTENKTFDSRQVMLVNNKIKKPNKDIVIVTIDDASFEYLTNKYGEWPLPRTVYADLINFIEQQNPLSISNAFTDAFSFKTKAVIEPMPGPISQVVVPAFAPIFSAIIALALWSIKKFWPNFLLIARPSLSKALTTSFTLS